MGTITPQTREKIREILEEYFIYCLQDGCAVPQASLTIGEAEELVNVELIDQALTQIEQVLNADERKKENPAGNK